MVTAQKTERYDTTTKDRTMSQWSQHRRQREETMMTRQKTYSGYNDNSTGDKGKITTQKTEETMIATQKTYRLHTGDNANNTEDV